MSHVLALLVAAYLNARAKPPLRPIHVDDEHECTDEDYYDSDEHDCDDE